MHNLQLIKENMENQSKDSSSDDDDRLEDNHDPALEAIRGSSSTPETKTSTSNCSCNMIL
jgi:hypothetical protein